MTNAAVTISSASEGVCLLCGTDGPVFEATTPCGRLIALPVCAKDLFALVVAQSRVTSSATRGPARGRGRPVAKTRTGTEGVADAETETGPSADTISSAA